MECVFEFDRVCETVRELVASTEYEVEREDRKDSDAVMEALFLEFVMEADS